MDEQTARCLLELDDQIQGLWRALEHHSNAEEFRAAARRHQERAEEIQASTESYARDFEKMIRNLHEESIKYINTVSVIGYTAYFATWAFTKGSMTNQQHALIGLLGMLSVAAFVLWEMLQGFVRLQAISDLSRIYREGISVENFERVRDEQLRREAKRMTIFNPAHKLVFLFSAGCAFYGGAMLMHLLYSSL
ncbi:hypothetical protein [Sinorhizobium sp. GL28]|uniref:hypothetical protein n=1 Tax=Sinorhizobium sp. GL28 TaxID=1358418 RepID=UPI00071DF143|nr:hypothetical protein [Sinorhizobium sp. GL28]KSV88283.1 hypothetical protein N184_29785 [Sinorhizobium sp. GL28]